MSVLKVLRGSLVVAAIVGFTAPAIAAGPKSLVAVSGATPYIIYADEKKCPEGEEWSEQTGKCEKIGG